MEKNKISKALVGKFEMVGYEPGIITRNGVKYDTTKMSVSEANKAIKEGVTFLRKIEPTANKEKESQQFICIGY